MPSGRRGFAERRSGDRRRVPVLTVLWHPDPVRVGEVLELPELLDGGAVTVGPRSPFSPPGVSHLGRDDRDGVREGVRVGVSHLGDMSERPSCLELPEIRLEVGSTERSLRLTRGEGRGSGRVLVDGRGLERTARISAAGLEAGVVLQLGDRVVLLFHSLSARRLSRGSGSGGAPRSRDGDDDLVGASEALEEVRREIRRVSDLEVPVLIRGETGTGKELVAQAIHRRSRRRERHFLSVNLAAVPPSLAASELFGAAKGAFTGAVRPQAGYFVQAHRGTLFLDEVGEAPVEVQVMLLRVLETGEVQPLGAAEAQSVDVRLVAATDLDLETASSTGDFRAPLLHRLASYELRLPPLRARRDDLGRLLLHFLKAELREVGEEHHLEPSPDGPPWLPASVVARLARYPWPGNVRELRNVVRQLVIGSRGSSVARIDNRLERLLREASGQPSPVEWQDEGDASLDQEAGSEAPGGETSRDTAREAPGAPRYRSPGDVGDEELLAALRQNRFAIKPTAKDLGLSRSSLYDLIARTPKVRKAAELSRAEIAETLDAVAEEMGAGERPSRVTAEAALRLEVSADGLRRRMRELEMGPL